MTTIVFGSGAGIGATGSVSGTAPYLRVSITTGTSTAGTSGNSALPVTIATVTLTAAAANTLVPVFSANNEAAARLSCGLGAITMSGNSTTQFVIRSGGSALQALTTYIWGVVVGG